MENGANGISKKYIKRLKRALKKRRAYDVGIIRDVNEMFENTASEEKSAEELILRLGSPEDFAAKFDRTERPYAGVAAFTVAAVSLLAGIMFVAAYAVGKLRGVPEDAIGYAESATEIFVTGIFVTGGVGTEAWLISGTVLVLISPILAWITRKIVAKRKKNG